MLKVLIVKTSALGDLVQIFPAIKAIKRIAPEASIDWVVEKASAPIAKAHPDISEVIVLDSKKWRKNPFHSLGEVAASARQLRVKSYDVLFDFQSNTKSALITLLAKSKQKIGYNKKVAEWPARWVTHLRRDPSDGQNIRQDYLDLVSLWSGKTEALCVGTLLNVSPPEEFAVQSLLKQKEEGVNILVAPFSRWPNKQLSDSSMENLLLAIEKQSKKAVKFWLISGNDEERQRANKIASSLSSSFVVPALTIPQLQRLMCGMDQVISVDSLALSLAYEAQVPVFALFGSSSPQKFSITNDNSSSFFGACPYGKTFEKRCPLLRSCKTGSCIRDPSIDEILKQYSFTI